MINKVLVFGITDVMGGVESVIMNYYRAIDRKRIQFDFLCNTEKVAYEGEIKKLGGKVYRVTARSKNPSRYKHELSYFFEKHAHEYSSIWVNVCSLANIDYLKYAKKYGINKRIIHCHNSQNMDSFLRGALHKINRITLKKYATDFWSCSDKASKFFYNRSIRHSNKYLLIKNAIDYNKFKYDKKIRKQYRNKLGLGNKLVFANIGRFHFQKNQSFLIDIFNDIKAIKPDSTLLLIGEGEDENKLREQVNQYKLSNDVKFLEPRKDISSILQAVDIVIAPSLFEGLSLSILEAQASGALVFTSTSVSRECNLSDHIYFLNLSTGSDNWAEFILTIFSKSAPRTRRKDSISGNGYNINQESKRLEALFE